MLRRLLLSNFLQVSLSLLLLFGAALCMFTPDVFLLKWGATFTVQIMLAYLALSMLFLFTSQQRLMLVCLVCCGMLAMYLKNSSNGHLRLASKTEEPELRIGHINLSLAEEYEATVRTILDTDLDVWTFQEMTPDWDQVLEDALCDQYPYDATFVRIDPYGLSVWSKYPLEVIDTFNFDGIPNLRVSIPVGGERYVHIVSSHTKAPVNSSAYHDIRMHFREISRYIRTLDGPVITCGDYNLPSWAPEVKEYKNLAELQDSRRDINPASVQGSFSLFKVPIDHIFYTDEVECTSFRVIDDIKSRHLGIIGTYQLKEIFLQEAG